MDPFDWRSQLNSIVEQTRLNISATDGGAVPGLAAPAPQAPRFSDLSGPLPPSRGSGAAMASFEDAVDRLENGLGTRASLVERSVGDVRREVGDAADAIDVLLRRQDDTVRALSRVAAAIGGLEEGAGSRVEQLAALHVNASRAERHKSELEREVGALRAEVRGQSEGQDKLRRALRECASRTEVELAAGAFVAPLRAELAAQGDQHARAAAEAHAAARAALAKVATTQQQLSVLVEQGGAGGGLDGSADGGVGVSGGSSMLLLSMARSRDERARPLHTRATPTPTPPQSVE